MSNAKRTAAFASRLWRSPRVRVATFAAVACVGFGIATCLDAPAHRLLHPERREDFMSGDLLWMLRSVGYLPSWVALAAIMLLVDRRPKDPALGAAERRPNRRGWLMLIAVGAAGASNAILKVLIGRLRPPTWTAWDGHYVFHSWADNPLSSSGLALPSGHASVAFTGMFLLCRMYPKASPVFVLLAAGCAFTRVATRGHFVSDVWTSAILGWVLAWLLWRLLPMWRGRTGRPD